MPLPSRSTRLENGAETGEMEWPSGWQGVHKGDSSLVFGILIVATNHFWFLCFQCNFPVPKSVTARPGVHLWLSRWNQLLLWYCLSWIFFLPVVLDPQKKKVNFKIWNVRQSQVNFGLWYLLILYAEGPYLRLNSALLIYKPLRVSVCSVDNVRPLQPCLTMGQERRPEKPHNVAHGTGIAESFSPPITPADCLAKRRKSICRNSCS